MKIYKVDRAGDEHDGYYFTTNKKDAERAVKEQDEECLIAIGSTDPYYSIHDVKLTKKSILSFLNAQCSHPDNG